MTVGLERLGRGLTGRACAEPKQRGETDDLPVHHGPDSEMAWREAESVVKGVATELLVDAAAVLQKECRAPGGPGGPTFGLRPKIGCPQRVHPEGVFLLT